MDSAGFEPRAHLRRVNRLSILLPAGSEFNARDTLSEGGAGTILMLEALSESRDKPTPHPLQCPGFRMTPGTDSRTPAPRIKSECAANTQREEE